MAPASTLIDGRYRVERELGRGGMGRVVLVREDLATSGPPRGPCACKILERDALVQAFLAEAELLARLSHPGFVRAHRLGTDEAGRRYALLSACDGPSLQDAPDADPVAVGAALLRALDHLHRLGFVHGDVAPANVLRAAPPASEFVLVDLGASGPAGSRAGATSGVLAFVAPERLEGGPLSPASDLWATGALLFRLAHGRHPFPGYPQQPLSADARPDRAHRPPHPLDPLLDRLLDVRPEERPPSAAAALVQLEALSGIPAPLVPPSDLAARLAQPTFVDVGRVLADLSARVAEADRLGRGLVELVRGGDGSGKSRLLAELGSRLAARGLRPVEVAPVPGDAPGGLIQRLLGRLGAKPYPAAEGPPRPVAMAQAVASAARAARVRPVLLVDDLHLADALSRQALEALDRATAAVPDRQARLLLVAATRDPSGGLPPWRAEDVELLLQALFPGRRVGGRVSAPLAEAARGNPGALTELLTHLSRQGVLEVDAAAVRLTGPVEAALPSLDDRARARLAATPPELRRELSLLAWTRRPLPAALLGGMTDALIEAGLAVALPDVLESPRVTTASTAIAAIAREALDPTRAHRELAARWRRAAGPDAPEALWHALEAGDPGAPERAEAALAGLTAEQRLPLLEALVARGGPGPEAAMAGAQVAADRGRFDLAEALLERALSGADDPVVASRVLTRRGALLARQSRHAAAIEAFRAAELRGAGELGPGDAAEIGAGIARSAVLSGDLDEAHRCANEAMALTHDPALRGRLGYTMGLAAWFRGELDAAQTRLEAALVDIRRAEDGVEEAAVVTALGLVAHRRGQLDAAVAHYEAALRLGERAGDDARVLTALQNLGVVHHERGVWPEALDTYREALALAEGLGQTGRVIQLAGNLGNLWRFLGELTAAREVLTRGLTLARAEANRHMEAILLTLLGEIALAEERWPLAEELLDQAIAAATGSQSATEEIEARLNLARLRLERQDHGAAKAAADEALALAERIESRGLAVQARALVAAAAHRSVHGDVEHARQQMEAALADLDAVTNPDGRWPVLVEAALLAAALGDEAASAARAAEARRLLQQLEDAVPAKHRSAFRQLRERRNAWRILSTLTRPASEAAVPAAVDGRWERLLEINKRLNTEYDVRRLLEYIMDSAILLTGAERGFLLLASDTDTDGDLDVHVARNIDRENLRNTRFKISHSIAKRVIETGDPVLTVDAMEDARYREHLSVHDLRLRSVLCLPMRVRGRVIGAIYLDNRFRAAAFGDQDTRFMEAFADQAGIAVSNAQLIEVKEQSQRALEQSQREVEALNRKLASQLEARTRELEDTHKVVVRQQRQLEARHTYGSIIGSSRSLRSVFAVMDRLLDNNIPVLIEGESGTGKELVARAIHFNGARRDRPFVAVNCGAIPANLLETELFGHVRGAFTGATSDKKGLFEAAHGGTLLLDELGELPLEMQVKLLRVLQNGEIKKVGATADIRVDVRIVAATNRRLEEEVAHGRFREDLYYRLSVVPIQLPPLRDRRDDIPELVQHFLQLNQASGLSRVSGVTPTAMALLQGYHWPGNIRQLEMVLKNASLFAEGDALQPADFHSFPDIVGAPQRGPSSTSLSGRTLADIERDAIIQALEDTRGNKKRAAEQLGIDRRTLYNKLRAYNIVIERELTVT